MVSLETAVKIGGRSFADQMEGIPITADLARRTFYDAVNRMLNTHPYDAVFKSGELKRFVLDTTAQIDFDDRIWIESQKLRIRDIDACNEPFNYDNLAATAILAPILGRECSYKDLITLSAGGFMHDIGKISSEIPNSIIYKHGKHTSEESKLMKLHPEQGYQFLISNGEIREPVSRSCLEHHVCIFHDGSPNAKCCSYPAKTRDDQPCFEARLIEITDAADAIISNRYYRNQDDYKNGKNSSYQKAIDELRRESELSEQNPHALHFDKKLVELFIPCLEKAIK